MRYLESVIIIWNGREGATGGAMVHTVASLPKGSMFKSCS